MTARSDWTRVVRRDPCVYCGGPVAHIDHIEAKARGGVDEWSNLTGACAACNITKGDHGLLRFLLRRRAPRARRAPRPKREPREPMCEPRVVSWRAPSELVTAIEAVSGPRGRSAWIRRDDRPPSKRPPPNPYESDTR